MPAILLATWVVSVPALGVVAFVLWFRRLRAEMPFWRSALGLATLTAVLANWVCFLWLACIGEIGGFGTHFITTRSLIDTFWCLSLPLARLSLSNREVEFSLSVPRY